MRSVIVHGILAAIGLAAAWWVWQDGDQVKRTETAVTLFACDDDKLTQVVFENEKKRVTIDIGREGGEASGWITVTEKATKMAKGATPTKADIDAFAASEKLSRIVAKVAPFAAERSLGEVDAGKIADLGLKESKETISVACGGEKRSYHLGSKTYGGRTRYIRSSDGGAVHLVGNSLVGDLEMAEFRFMQRDLLRLDLTDADEATVSGQGGTIKLVHRSRRQGRKAMWVSAAAPDQRNELYGNWLAKLMRLRALDYLKKGEGPGSAKGKTAVPVDVVKVELKGDKAGRIEIVKIPFGNNDADYFARTTATRGWVTVPKSLAAQIESDVGGVVGIDKPDSSNAAAAPGQATAASK